MVPPVHPLFQRINHSLIACQINVAPREDRSRLKRASQFGGPDNLARRCVVGGECASLNAYNAVTNNRRCRDAVPDPGLPAEPASMNIEGIKESVFTAYKRRLAAYGRGRRNAQACIKFPALRAVVDVERINGKIL